MSDAAPAKERIRWNSIEEVPEEWRRFVPPIPPRSWILDVPREQLARMGPDPNAEARIRGIMERAAERRKLSRQGVPLFMRLSDGSVIRCMTEEELQRSVDRMDAIRAGTRGEGWNLVDVIREFRDRDPAKLGARRAPIAAAAPVKEEQGAD